MNARYYAYRALSSPLSVWVTNLVARVLCNGQIANRGRVIDTNDFAVSAWVRTLVFWGIYETAELRLIERHLPRDIDVIELGGSIGVIAAQIAGHLIPGTRLISVEANPT